MNKICVLMPNYNNALYITKAIDSCKKQTVPVDIQIVDDGSTDRSIEIIRTYADDKSINHISQENKGPAAARNAGLLKIFENPNYEYVILLDSDDYLYPNFAEKCLEHITQDGVIGAYGDYHILINEPDVEPFLVREYKRSFNHEGIWSQCLMPHLAMFEVSAFKAVIGATGGLYDQSLRVCNDYDMDLKLAQQGVIWHIPEVIAVVREGVNNSCSPIQGNVRQQCMNKLRQNNWKFYQ